MLKQCFKGLEEVITIQSQSRLHLFDFFSFQFVNKKMNFFLKNTEAESHGSESLLSQSHVTRRIRLSRSVSLSTFISTSLFLFLSLSLCSKKAK